MKPNAGPSKVRPQGPRGQQRDGKQGSVQKKTQFKGKQNNQRPGKDAKTINYVMNPQRLKHQMMQAQKQEKREAFKQQKEEKAKKFNDFQKRKFERNKILGQKTRHGQPVMKGRMEMLLNKIQYQMSKES